MPLLLGGAGHLQSAGGCSESGVGMGVMTGALLRHGNGATSPPPLVRPRHSRGSFGDLSCSFSSTAPVAVRSFFLSPQSLYLVLGLIFAGTPFYLAESFTGDHTVEATYRAQLSLWATARLAHVEGQL